MQNDVPPPYFFLKSFLNYRFSPQSESKSLSILLFRLFIVTGRAKIVLEDLSAVLCILSNLLFPFFVLDFLLTAGTSVAVRLFPPPVFYKNYFRFAFFLHITISWFSIFLPSYPFLPFYPRPFPRLIFICAR